MGLQEQWFGNVFRSDVEPVGQAWSCSCSPVVDFLVNRLVHGDYQGASSQWGAIDWVRLVMGKGAREYRPVTQRFKKLNVGQNMRTEQEWSRQGYSLL